jgi:hypothetical protein
MGWRCNSVWGARGTEESKRRVYGCSTWADEKMETVLRYAVRMDLGRVCGSRIGGVVRDWQCREGCTRYELMSTDHAQQKQQQQQQQQQQQTNVLLRYALERHFAEALNISPVFSRSTHFVAETGELSSAPTPSPAHYHHPYLIISIPASHTHQSKFCSRGLRLKIIESATR